MKRNLDDSEVYILPPSYKQEHARKIRNIEKNAKDYLVLWSNDSSNILNEGGERILKKEKIIWAEIISGVVENKIVSASCH